MRICLLLIIVLHTIIGTANAEILPQAYYAPFLDNEAGESVWLTGNIEMCVNGAAYISYSKLMKRLDEPHVSYEGDCWAIMYTLTNHGSNSINGVALLDKLTLQSGYYPMNEEEEGLNPNAFWENFDHLYESLAAEDKWTMAFFGDSIEMRMNAIKVVDENTEYCKWNNFSDVTIAPDETISVLDVRSYSDPYQGECDILAYCYEDGEDSVRVSVHDIYMPFSDSNWEASTDVSPLIIAPLWEIGLEPDRRGWDEQGNEQDLEDWLCEVVYSFQEYVGLEPTGDLDMETFMWIEYKRNHVE